MGIGNTRVICGLPRLPVSLLICKLLRTYEYLAKRKIILLVHPGNKIWETAVYNPRVLI